MPPIGYIISILFIICVSSILIVFLELYFFDLQRPQLREGTTIEQWKENFQTWAFVCAGVSGAVSLLWYILAQWYFKINKWEDTDNKRWVWVLFWFLCLVLPIIFIIARVGVEEVKSGSIWVYAFFVANGLLPYYLITLFFSPAAFKYIPWKAKKFRSPCPW